MKRMKTEQKKSWNKLTAKRTKRALKRKAYRRIYKLLELKENIKTRRAATAAYYRNRYIHSNTPKTKARIL